MLLMALACIENGLNEPGQEIDEPLRELVVAPAGLDFGEVELGAERTMVFTISSVGNAPVALDELSVTGPSSFSVHGLPTDELAPGEELEIAVSYTAQSLWEEGHVRVYSDAVIPVHEVLLEGTAIAPLLEIDPPKMDLVSPDGSARQGDFVLKSVGTQTLELHELLLLGDDSFSILEGQPVSLEPGDQTRVTILWEPEDTYETAELWVTDNTPLGSAMAPITGTMPPPCMGLAEAWNIGSLYARVDGMGTMILENQDPDLDICIDDWTVWISPETQDMGLGDIGFDPGGEYPLGSLQMGPGDSQQFTYGALSGNAWYCMELTQLTQPTDNWTFFGARVPTPLRSDMLNGDQDGVWEYMEFNPVPVVGRDTNAVVPGDTVVLRSVNMGRRVADFRLVETLPAGWAATDFSVEPDDLWINSDSSTSYAWDLSLGAAYDTGEYDATIYDWSLIRYTLEMDGADCKGRMYLEEVEAWWTDHEGQDEISLGSPLLVTCE